MKINVTTNGLKELIPRIEKFRASIVPITAGILTKQIKVLSQEQQKDFEGNPFPQLTPAYKKRKVKAGHPGVPNLTFSGKYMNRIGLRQDGDTPYVGPVASFLPQAEGLSKLRPHFGVHPDSIRNTEKALSDAWGGIVG